MQEIELVEALDVAIERETVETHESISYRTFRPTGSYIVLVTCGALNELDKIATSAREQSETGFLLRLHSGVIRFVGRVSSWAVEGCALKLSIVSTAITLPSALLPHSTAP
jgi:hypothetical protein